MTNKRKIQILKEVIKRFERIIPKFDKDKDAAWILGGSYGICDQINLLQKSYYSTIDVQREFNVKMPRVTGMYKWKLDKRGYQARINACKKAIERLSK